MTDMYTFLILFVGIWRWLTTDGLWIVWLLLGAAAVAFVVHIVNLIRERNYVFLILIFLFIFIILAGAFSGLRHS